MAAPHPPLPFDLRARRQGGARGAADERVRRRGRACRPERDAGPSSARARRSRRGSAVGFPGGRAAAGRAAEPPRLWRLARYMRGFDLVLTYNWGAFDAVMARHLFGGPPLVHHEDGFNEDEAERLKPEAQPLPPARAAARRTGWSCRRSGWRRSRARPGGSAGRSCASPTASPVARLRQAAGAGRDSGLRAAGRRGGDRHRRRAARGQEPAAAGPRLRRHDATGRRGW